MRGRMILALMPRFVCAVFALLTIAGAVALPYGTAVAANDLPLAAGSPLAGVAFDDRPLLLPVQRNFQMAMLTASAQIGRSCGPMEAYGWRMSQAEQHRVNLIFSNTVNRLRALGYTVEAQSPSAVSKDVTLFTADRPDRHFIFMWSAGEIGLVMVLCQSSGPPTGRVASLYNPPAASAPAIQPQDVLQSRLAMAPEGRSHKGAADNFSPVGDWVGDYTCMRGYTGATMHIDPFRGEDFRGTFRFYPTSKNPYVSKGSYAIYGQYDRTSRRILINPGNWIEHPKGYYKTIVVGSFDPDRRSFSGFFQGIMGCTSFEAKAGVKNEIYAPAPAAHTRAKPKKKRHVASKKKPAAKVPAKAAAPAEESIVPDNPPSAPAEAPATTVAPAATAPAPSSVPAPAPAPSPAPDAAAPASPPPASSSKPTSSLEKKYGHPMLVLVSDWPGTPGPPQLPPAAVFTPTVPAHPVAPNYNGTATTLAPAARYNTTPPTIAGNAIYDTTAPRLPPAADYDTAAPSHPLAPQYDVNAPQLPPAARYNTTVPELPTAPSYSIYKAPGT